MTSALPAHSSAFRPLFRRIGRWGIRAALWLALGLLALIPGLARADDLRAPPTPATLIGVQLVSETPKETKLLLSFTPRANSFGPVGTDSGKIATGPALGLALTSRANSAVAPPGLKGRVRSISFRKSACRTGLSAGSGRTRRSANADIAARVAARSTPPT